MIIVNKSTVTSFTLVFYGRLSSFRIVLANFLWMADIHTEAENGDVKDFSHLMSLSLVCPLRKFSSGRNEVCSLRYMS